MLSVWRPQGSLTTRLLFISKDNDYSNHRLDDTKIISTVIIIMPILKIRPTMPINGNSDVNSNANNKDNNDANADANNQM